MSEAVVYLNGQLLPRSQARISPLDRGFLFGDGVYEGLRVEDGAVIGERMHEDRLRDGLRETRIASFDPREMTPIAREVMRANQLDSAFVYLQITRGAPADDQPMRTRDAAHLAAFHPTVFAFATPLPRVATYETPTQTRAATRPDTRWERGGLKSISLLGGALAALEAAEAGTPDALLLRDGLLAEGVHTNAFVARGESVATPDAQSVSILDGVTRRLLLAADPSIEARAVSESELRSADEIMLVGTSTMVVSVTALDGEKVGSGHPGPQATRLLRLLVGECQRQIGASHPGAPHPGACTLAP